MKVMTLDKMASEPQALEYCIDSSYKVPSVCSEPSLYRSFVTPISEGKKTKFCMCVQPPVKISGSNLNKIHLNAKCS